MDINYDTITSTINQNTNWYFRRKSVFEESIKVEYYENDHKLKEVMQRFFIKNQKSSLKIHQFKFFFKLLACIFYVLRILYDNNESFDDSFTESNCTESQEVKALNWCAIIWVDRNQSIWLLQSLVAVCCLVVATIHPYLQYNGNIRRIVFNRTFLIELLCNFPFVITLVKPSLNSLFIPSFLNCWLAKQTLDDIYCERNRVRQSQSALSHRLMTLSATLVCLIFTSVCGFQHTQRAGGRNVTLLEALYFVIVTFSTVGYGDYKPDNIISQVFVVFMICTSIVVLPSQFEQLIQTYKERKKMGQNFHLNLTKYDKHVVVCSTTLDADMILDFLNEFYAHPLLQDFYTILLSPCELDFTMKTILQSPIWAQRVIYIRGSVLKDADMRRASIHEAEACFILAVRNCDNYDNADEHNILRSFAIRDFAPDVPQYVQIFRAKNKMHVAFAEQVVCEDEFKYALLANNCLNPGTSTLITLLIHTSRGEEGKTSEEQWHKLYGKSSGNEIYHVQLKDSRFFGEYDGKSFTYAAFNSHKKYGVTLIGVQTNIRGLLQIILNPGPAYQLRETDILFYINVNEEKNAFFTTLGSSAPPEPVACWVQRSPSSSQSPVERYANRNQKRQSRFSISGLQKSTGRFISRGHLFGRSSSEGGEAINNSLFTISGELNNNVYKSNFNGITNPAMESICSKSGRPQSECVQCTSATHHQPNTGLPNQLAVPGSQQAAQNQLSVSSQHTLSQNTAQNTLQNTVQNSQDSKRFLEIPSFTRRNRHLSIDRVPECINEMNLKELKFEEKETRSNIFLQGEHIEVVKDYPPEIPYIGISPIRCFITKEKRPHCCLILDKRCKHTSNSQAEHYKWANKSIILGAQSSSNGIYNFILRLRAQMEPVRLRPIVLLLEKKPNVCFLDAISWFPLVYWTKGSIDNLDNLLIAGIHKSDSVVVVNNESTNDLFSIHLADCNTIVAVQSMFKMFPGVRIMSELSQSSNMRFMQFRAHDIYALSCSKREKLEQERGSHISYIFRLPFAAGSVFSASMLDTLLYQSFVKEYMISIVRHLLGIEQTNNSGYLSCKKITKDDLWIRTYQRLFQRLATTTYEIPIGIYRTQKCPVKQLARTTNPIIDRDYVSQYQQVSVEIERQEIANLVRNRMRNFGIPLPEAEDRNANNCDQLSYVIVNPEKDLLLEEGDIIYIIKQANIEF